MARKMEMAREMKMGREIDVGGDGYITERSLEIET